MIDKGPHRSADIGQMLSLAVQQHQAGDYAGAIRRARRAIELQPLVPDYHNNLGSALKEHGDLE